MLKNKHTNASSAGILSGIHPAGTAALTLVCLCLSLLGTTMAASQTQRSTAFFYAANPPVSLLSQFDRVVVEPLNTSNSDLAALRKRGASTFAYLSIGELGAVNNLTRPLPDRWVLGKNDTWNSKVIDLTVTGWHRIILQQVDALVARGFNGLFLDTLDSYQLYSQSDEQRAAQQVALASLIQRIAKRHRGIRLIANRGFEVMERIAPVLEAVAAESLYESFNHATGGYQAVNEQDRLWLLGKLNQARNQFALDVIAIDYVSPTERGKARETATKIASHGFVPWVANPQLDYVGISTLEAIPREVLLIYDSKSNGPQHEADVHGLIATPLEYFGYVPVYHDVRVQGPPKGRMAGRYAGIVSWSLERHTAPGVESWLQEQIGSGVRVALFGHPGIEIDNELAERMGIEILIDPAVQNRKLAVADDLVGFETEPPLRFSGFSLVAGNRSPNNSVHLSYKSNDSVEAALVLTGPWGGYAADPGVSDSRVNLIPYWIIDPFKFLNRALNLGSLPMPDVTSENGKRLWLAHIDGDALPSWAEMPGRKLGAEIIDEQILDNYPLPHTISIVQAEMTALNRLADRRDRMFRIAKKMFARENVEIASHTFSHPYTWGALQQGSSSGVSNLPVPGYGYDIRREIHGAADFIDNNLAPDNKKTEVLLWSGDALPTRAALAATLERNLINMNGGNTTISDINPVLSTVSPMARTVDGLVQAYAPIMNENVYTNDWTGPFYGFHRVIQTLNLTEHPRRLKPINIYYHFYAGTKIATLKALREVYDWTLTQEIHPVYVSEYAEKVPDFRNVGVARYLDGRWKVSGLGSIRSLRMIGNGKQWPDMQSSPHLTGAKKLQDGMYIHTDGAQELTFRTSYQQPTSTHLVSANGKVTRWRRDSGGLQFRIQSHVPTVLELSGSRTRLCSIRSNGRVIKGVPGATNTTIFNFPTKDTGNAVLDCQT